MVWFRNIRPLYLIRGIKRYIAWHSPLAELRYRVCRLLGVRWVLKSVQGSEMLLDLSEDDPVSVPRPLFTYGIREPLSTEILRKSLRKGMRVVDIGANIGYYALLESKIVGDEGRVHAIEPSPKAFTILSYNVKTNDCRNVRLYNIALGDRKSKARLKIVPKATNANRIAHSDLEDDSIEVEMTTLDDLLNNRTVDFIRMDVEGYEYHIIKGMKNTLAKSKLRIFMELHPEFMKNYEEWNTEEMLQMLTDYGFRTKYIVYNPPVPSKVRFLDDPYFYRIIKCDLIPISLLKTGHIVQFVHLLFEK